MFGSRPGHNKAGGPQQQWNCGCGRYVKPHHWRCLRGSHFDNRIERVRQPSRPRDQRPPRDAGGPRQPSRPEEPRRTSRGRSRRSSSL
eukprot:6200529-Pyramimonas_sp.AAC.1